MLCFNVNCPADVSYGSIAGLWCGDLTVTSNCRRFRAVRWRGALVSGACRCPGAQTVGLHPVGRCVGFTS
uniref:Uncharacterized protein n=1 Tax=Anguilla anguilla TaxID=7936 RepID=A0A0E9QX03_ANGAN